MNHPDDADRLHRLVYVSRNLVSARGDALLGVIQDILDAARRNNGAFGVTGALMFNTDVFAQVLEGPREAVQQVFERIQVDERHDDVRILDWAPVEARSFPTWSMAYAGPDTAAASRFDEVLLETEHDMARLHGDALLEVLRVHLGVAPARPTAASREAGAA